MLTKIIAVIVASALVFASCSDEPAPVATGGSEGGDEGGGGPTLRAIAILHPNGDVSNGWLAYLDGNGDGDINCFTDPEDCCEDWTPLCTDVYRAIDENYANRNQADYLVSFFEDYDPVARFTFSDISDSCNINVTQIKFVFGRIRFDMDGPGYDQALLMRYFIGGTQQDSGVNDCLNNDPCDGVDSEWTKTFTGLNLNLTQVNTLELEVEERGYTNPADGKVYLYQVHAEVTYQRFCSGEG
jgi:hypothetical protein